MRDAATFGRFMARPASEPHTDADRPDLGHRLGEKTETVIENVSDDDG